MLTLGAPNLGCTDNDAELLRRRVAPSSWPDDHLAFLRENDGGRAVLNTFPVRTGLSDTLARMYGVSEILRQKATLSDRMAPNVWPIADTTSGNFIVFVVADSWSVGFWDHETEGVTEVARTFAQFSMTVGPPIDPKLHSRQVRAVTLSPGFAEKFAKFKKKV
jgi:hypothetical protein